MSDPNCPYIDIFSLVYSVKDITLKEQFGRTYEIVRYQREHTQNYCVYEVNNGIRDGTAELFENGLLKLRWKMKNGMRDGDYVVYDKGMRIGEGRWKDYCDCTIEIVGSRWRKLIMIMRVNGAVNYEGEFNSLMQRDGMGFAYENGVLRQYGRWKGDEMVEEKQYFTSVTEMIEYANGSTSDLLTHRPVYVGGYQLDEQTGEMKRHGYGRVLNERSGICEYESEWALGKERKGNRVSMNDGWYHDHPHSDSTREVTNGTTPLMMGNMVLVTKPLELELFRTSSNCYNNINMTRLQLIGLPRLKTVAIGSNSFGSVRVFEIIGSNELESITVGNCSLTYARSDADVYYSTQADGSCRIVDCPKLKTISIGEHAFSDYHSFELSNLPSLQKISIGWQCFYRAPSLVLSGRTSCLDSPVDFPQLVSAQFGWEVFCHCQSVVFESE